MQIVLIDHGMYGNITPRMRKLMSELFLATMFFNKDVKIKVKIGVGENQ